MSEFDYDVNVVLVTGALGNIGPWVVDRLADDGTHVVGVDFDRPAGHRVNADFWALDLTDQGTTWELVHDVDPDAIVHLAAISDPVYNPGTRVFENNTKSTYNVLTAAGRAGIDLVWTSSQAVYGALFAESAWMPDYLPIDERHECRPEDSYGLSKVCCEEIAGTVARRDDVSVTTIRPATIFGPDRSRARPSEENVDLARDVTGGNFGSYVDVRDVARMVEAALASEHEGHEAVLCAADENYLGRPTAELVEAICGALPDECELEGRQAALSNAKAADLLGWTPKYPDPTRDAESISEPTWV
ncbi:NAD-dependent epimerase/dehydratase family protein [Halorubrum sp. CBA1125]|uniref:NAD-dependent epimerase/dehydratase family protein n=1 Tax=Halorubrum sp. CBA1125 TaxID=2668072 RepID=UPI0012E85B7D|nr:NAD(P)-dependent oxidoreductase [Halorubrum sp. CBA1125]MUW15588.1 NAD-dependent epimerase/dehydratase family protein [Halorubrum sp. CBA1125]